MHTPTYIDISLNPGSVLCMVSAIMIGQDYFNTRPGAQREGDWLASEWQTILYKINGGGGGRTLSPTPHPVAIYFFVSCVIIMMYNM